MTEKIYDLHTHSTASDGTLTPTELVQRAAEQQVSVLALTDHDSVSGLTEAGIAAESAGIQLINGVEVSTEWENRGIHIVGLGFDKTHQNLTALLQQQAQVRHQRALEIGLKLEKVGIPNAFDGAKKLADGEVTRAHFARYLVQIGEVKNEAQAFKKYLTQGKPCFVKSGWATIPLAIETIHQAGGLAVLAHPLRYTMTNRWLRRLIDEFKQWGGDGIEVSGCGQTPDQRHLVARWANEFGLLGSVGSDFHFPCGWIEIGKSLFLPENVTPIWTELNEKSG
ncbi:PHP domain-containing protein [Bisgaard Taxon 10/6]|uniref:RNase RNM n=1 Tax=Exercitatus varius TaxID=67857 RepID=UPI00294B0917|nr:PHP domain-containing protein [Exercitatus varius]MDG2953518.1 PHP domain-containing protein [Exercitatus varius]